MVRLIRAGVCLAVLTAGVVAHGALPREASSQASTRPTRVTEETRTFTTYPFSEPNPIPILARDTRLYPYHSFEGYAHDGVPRQWKVVRLENDLIEVLVLPEIGGKVWGARVKKTGHEFIYQNDVVKFRNIALRGPWTSGGIEFNFGVIGHAPWTATPVDYTVRHNPDGSASCIVGTMDLPSRTQWRVEIRLPAGTAAFDTNVLWHNPTPLEQPYYNWMTAAASARSDLELSVPGTHYLQHSGASETWPVDDRGRFLPLYRNNTFGGSKSYHVVGELQHFFGGYYADAGYGFGHWARHEEMPGQKVWLWALSRSGAIWEDLLTDTRGQYVEFQAGRLLVQYTPTGDINPISQAGFEPYATERWTETWFPVEGLGGLTDASRDGAMFIHEADGRLQVAVHAFADTADTLKVWSGEELVSDRPLVLAALQPVKVALDHVRGRPFRVQLARLGLDYSSAPSSRTLARPVESDAAARPAMAEADRLVLEGRELMKGRRYDAARPLFERALTTQPWHRGALVAMADVEYRRARYEQGLVHVLRALRMDTYDAEANFTAGNLYRALGRIADARDALGWAARSMAYRSAANVQLSELAIGRGDWVEAERYARIALDYNRSNLSAWELLAVAGRRTEKPALAREAASHLAELDPLNHVLRAETYLSERTAAARDQFFAGLRSEYPEQTVLELAHSYADRGVSDDAVVLLEAATDELRNPEIRAWLAYLKRDPSLLGGAAHVAFAFPYRREMLPVLSWAAAEERHWSWTYLRALNLWALDRGVEAEALLRPLETTPEYAPFYVTRAHLLRQAGGDPEKDLQQAARLAANDRPLYIPLIRYYQERGRWADALAASAHARARFAGDFNLVLLHAQSLVHLRRADEAIAILDRTRVLPSENARDSHQIYAQAHTLAALAAIDAARYDAAYQHLQSALEWPEHLGQGRPYDPDERLVRFLMARVDERRAQPEDARRSFEAVVSATQTGDRATTHFDLLAVAALRALGRSTEADVLASRVATVPRDADDLEGEMISRALALASR